jgi:hypothetical protein
MVAPSTLGVITASREAYVMRASVSVQSWAPIATLAARHVGKSDLSGS